MYSMCVTNSAFLKGAKLPVKRGPSGRVRTNANMRMIHKIECTDNNVNGALVPTKSLVKTAEKLNGRLAMLGFLSGTSMELFSGMNYLDQLNTTWPFLTAMVGVISFATFKTRNLEVIEEAPFTTNLELLNGRMAMMGLLCKFIYDSGVLL